MIGSRHVIVIVCRGHRFVEHASTPQDLANKFANNARSLCLLEQIILDQPTEAIIRSRIGSTA